MADRPYHSHSKGETKALKVRVRKIVGQLNAIERMIETERDCAEILNQLISVRKAVKSLSEKLIYSHLHHCIETTQQSVAPHRNLRELVEVLERYVD